jgi:hypothetical protein
MKPSCYVLKACAPCDSVTPHKASESAPDMWTCMECTVAYLVAGQHRAGEARQRAFVDIAYELAELDPAARDATIRRIITQHEEGR